MQKFWTVGFIVALMTITLVTPASAQSSARIQNKNGLCIQPVSGLNAWNGDQIHQVPCAPYDASYFWTTKWITDASGAHWFQIKNVGVPGMCLDLTNGNTADRTPLQVWACNSTSTTMQWTYNPNGDTRFINRRSNKCMDVTNGESFPGNLIQSYRCAATTYGGVPNLAQIWNWF